MKAVWSLHKGHVETWTLKGKDREWQKEHGTDIENRLLGAKGEGLREGGSGRLGLADVSSHTCNG